MGKDVIMTPMLELKSRLNNLHFLLPKEAEGAKEQLKVVIDMISKDFVLKERQDLLECFKESRLTHPMIGFKHETFVDYYNSVYGDIEKNIDTLDVSDLPIKKAEKLPLGLKPKRFHDEVRYEEVCGAIHRFYNTGKQIPLEWIEEYNDLTKIINNYN